MTVIARKTEQLSFYSVSLTPQIKQVTAMESTSDAERWHSFGLHTGQLLSSANLATTDLCRDYCCLSQGSVSFQQEFDFSVFYWLL